MEFGRSGSGRTVKVDGESYLVPPCVCLITSSGRQYLGLQVLLEAGSCTVNGKTVSRSVAINYQKSDITMECLLVLR